MIINRHSLGNLYVSFPSAILSEMVRYSYILYECVKFSIDICFNVAIRCTPVYLIFFSHRKLAPDSFLVFRYSNSK